MKNIATVNTRLLVLLVLAAGIVIRLVNYLNDPGLWLSEAQLSLNIIERSYSQLLLPLDENQVAPILFLWIEKTITLVFGPTELPLRLFPILCSLLSLPLFYFVAGDLLKNKSATLIALFLFATAPIQIRYSAEVKQYISDVFVTLLLLWLYLQYLKGYRKSLVIQLSVAGILSIFLSNIAVLVLFSIGIHWLYRSVLQKTFRPELLYLLFLWIISFGLYYYFFIAGHQNEPLMLRYWEGNFMPLNPLSGEFYEFLWIKAGKVLHQFTLFNGEGASKCTSTNLNPLFCSFCLYN